MPRINAVGSFDVTIKSPRFELAEKDGDKNRMALVLPGHTAKGDYIDAYLYFTPKLAIQGQNKGRASWETSAEKCFELGMSHPFNPAKMSELEDVECVFVTEMDTYQPKGGTAKTTCKVKFINARRKPALTTEEAANVWAALSGEPVEAVAVEAVAVEAVAVEKSAPAGGAELPF